MSIVLPTKPIPSVTQDPKNLIIYGVPKVGKTSLLATLPNLLLVDLENGSDYISALKVKVNNFSELKELCVAVKEANCPYDFIALDTITALEEMVKPLALALYRKSPLGINDTVTNDVTTLPHGAGYGFLRTAMEMAVDMVSKVTKNIILVGHVKDKVLGSADSADAGSVMDLDLTGKISRILSSRSDAIGFIHRDDDSNLCINFTNGNEITAGARPAHLANQDIVVAERMEDGSFVSHWERIYPSLAQ